MKKRKIVFIIPSLTAGGAERVVSILANLLSKSHIVEIIQLYSHKPFYFLEDGIILKYCRVKYNSQTNFIKSIFNHFYMVTTIYKLIKTADLIIGFTTTSNIYTVVSSRLRGIPCIISERINPHYNIKNGLWLKLRKLIYPKAQKVVVQTTEIKKYFLEFVSSNKLEIVSNPLSPDLIKYRDLNSKKENIILHVGRLDRQKNQELLIRAFAKLLNKNWKLVLVGEGPLKQEYRALIDNLNLKNNIVLAGNSNTIYNEYNRAKIFVLTSNYEGFPNALTEAMHFGLACISTNCPTGPSELIVNNQNGVLIPLNDHDILEAKLKILIEDEALRKRIGENAIISTEKYNVNYVIKEWQRLINNVLK